MCVCSEQKRAFAQVWPLQLAQNSKTVALYTLTLKSFLRSDHFDVKIAWPGMVGHGEELEENY